MHKLIDLTQTIEVGIPDWDGCCGFQMHNTMDYDAGARAQEFKAPNGIGTHMDAPSHFVMDSTDIAGIGLERLVCPGVVIDVSHQTNQDYAIIIDDIIEFENKHGDVPDGAIVIGYSGWCVKWNSPNEYRNEDKHGVMHYPKFSVASIEYLLKRNINGIAVDTLSPDGSDYNFPVHHKLLGAGKFIIENLNVPQALPTTGFTIVALPIKIKGATEAPCRVIAFIED